MRYLIALLFVCIAASAFARQPPASAPRVESFSPQGTVKGVRQAVARFSEPMVRFGDARAEAPVTVDCATPGQGHWIDARQWVYDFANDVPAGQRCSFTLRKGLRALSAKPIAGVQQYAFDTGGPNIVDSLPSEGSGGIDENQFFVLALDAAASSESIRANAHCEIEGLGEQIELDLIQGDARRDVLTPALRDQYRYFFERFADEAEIEQKLAVLQCRRRFPADVQVRLVWGRGIATRGGLATTEDQVFSFRTRAAFNARFECQRVNARAQCVPFLPMKLFFSAPIALQKAEAIRLVGEAGASYAPVVLDPVKNPSVDAVTFTGPFPHQAKFKITLPTDLTDDAGRSLENAARFPLEVATDDYPPLAKFTGEFGIIEAKEGGILPVTLRNLENQIPALRLRPGPTADPGVPGKMQRFDQDDSEIIGWIKKVKAAAQPRGEWIEGPDGQSHWKELTGSRSVFDEAAQPAAFSVPKPLGEKVFEVVGIPLGQSGFYVVELASPRLGAALLGEAKPRYVATSALVTNLAVHFKWGRQRSLVWVTTLDQSKPVPDAAVRISDFCKGTLLWEGKTAADGTVPLEGGRLPEPNTERECGEWNESSPPVFVSARVEGDLGFTVSGWNKGIQPSNFGLTTGSPVESSIAHGVFDRSLFRAGETVSMKIFLRERVLSGFAVPAGDRPDQIRIRHGGSGQTYTQPVSFDTQGIAEATWNIPRDAKLGAYEVELYRGDQWRYEAGRFQVQQFRVPTMKAVIQPGPEPLVDAKQATVDLFVGYLSGGGAKGLPVKLRTLVRPRAVSDPNYPDYTFGGENIVEGIRDETYGDDEGAPPPTKPAQVLPLVLDASGAARATIPDLPVVDSPQDLVTELEYQDANGEPLTVAQNIPLWPAKIQLGLRTEDWVASKDRLRFEVLALDLSGKPLSTQPIRVELLHKTTFSYRKRLIGGFYAYENKSEVKRLAPSCEAMTSRAGVLACDLKPGVSGDVILRATAEDDEGNMALATQDVWVDAGDDWWFENGPTDRMDVVAEKPAYERGETARFQVRSPFREATALVTVEREGVIDAFVKPISGKSPVVDVPIKDHYAPNVYVSVLAVRGRPSTAFGWLQALGRKLNIGAKEERVTALVDLDKPAYRLGVGRIDVGWTPNRLDVRVAPNGETFRVRDEAKVRIAVSRADGGPLPDQAEVAFAAVDEGLLELSPNPSWRLLEQMMGRRGIEVYTSTAQMQVVGKRHYGRKAVSHGGGGGRQPARELFDTLLLWRGRVALDASGAAEVDVPLNDALTSFRLAAVAGAGTSHFGTGYGAIRTTQDLMAHSGLPPMVRQGDSFHGTFTIRNASERSMTVEAAVQLRMTAESEQTRELPSQTLALNAGEARELSWKVDVPAVTTGLEWELSVVEQGEGAARDRLRVAQQVIPAVPVRVHQATLLQLEQPVRMALAPPPGALPGRGGVRVALQAGIGADLSGVRDYMTRYPYSCLEQRVSKAVALRDEAAWREVSAQLPSYLDADGLFKYFPSEILRGSDTLTAYVLAVANEAGWSLPAEVQARALEGLKSFVAGTVARASRLATPDLMLRKLTAIEALSRYGAAKPEMLSSVTLEPKLWPTSAVLDWLNVLSRLEGLPQQVKRKQDALQVLRSRFTVRGTALGLSTEESDRLWWLMTTPDASAAKAVLTLADQTAWKEDLPKLVAGALGRQVHGHWDTTVANTWGTLAMEKFTHLFQGTPVSGATEVKLGETSHEFAWPRAGQGGQFDFGWPERESWLELEQKGTGAPWITIQSRAALPLQQPDFNGYTVQRTIHALEQKQPGEWSRGDVARVRLELDAQADMTWVVVDDPLPAGASILGTGLGRDSAMLSSGEQHEGSVWPVYEERRFDAFRAYYDYVPKGRWRVEYTVRFNNPGHYALPPTRVEALYAPDVYGEFPNAAVEIRPDP